MPTIFPSVVSGSCVPLAVNTMPSVVCHPIREQLDQQEMPETVGGERGLVAFGVIGKRPIVSTACVA